MKNSTAKLCSKGPNYRSRPPLVTFFPYVAENNRTNGKGLPWFHCQPSVSVPGLTRPATVNNAKSGCCASTAGEMRAV